MSHSDYDKIKKIAEDIVYRSYKGDKELIKELIYCTEKNYSRGDAAHKLSKLVGRSKSRDLIETFYDQTSSIRRRKYLKKDDNDMEQPKCKVSKSEPNAIKTIQNDISNKYIPDSDDKAKKVNLLQSKIQQSLAKYGFSDQTNGSEFLDPNLKNVSVKLSQTGETIDALTGLPVTLVKHTPTAKINVRVKRKQLLHSISNEIQKSHDQAKEETLIQDTQHFDPRLMIPSSLRNRKTFKFNEPGKFINLAQTKRAKTQLELLQDKIQSISKKTGIAAATKLAMVTIQHQVETSDKVPEIEWWDAAILPSKAYSAFNKLQKEINIESISTDTNLNKMTELLVGITNLIEHPVPRLPPGEAKDTSTLPVYLTKHEQKKIRMQRRRQNEKEKQEKILLGIIPPPPPKVKMSNLMRVLGTEAVQDPTKVENYVKQQIATRKMSHEQANAERKLTPAQKKAKLIRKYNEDTSLAVHISVYRILDLSNHSKKFKVDKNAQQNFMTGCLITFQDMNLLVMEGGPKAQKRMKRLLLHRIKWAEDTIKSSTRTSDQGIHNKCVLVWEGTNGYRNFKNWEVIHVKSEANAKEFLKKYSSDHYWELAYSLSLIDDELKT